MKSNKLSWVVLIFFLSDFQNCSTETTLSVPLSTETLQVAQVIFRHGARNIDMTYANDPYADESFWPGGYSQLTCIGEIQGYELGRYLRQKYDGFINETYIPKEIHALSSDLDRTIQTADSVLAGFYPPNEFIPENHEDCNLIQWKAVPVHSIPADLDNILRQTKVKCPKYTSLQDDFYENSDIMKELVEKNLDLLIYFAENTQLDITRTSDFSDYYDTLVVENYFNYTLPPWTGKIFGTKEATELATFYFPSLTYTDEMKRLRAGPLIKRIIRNFNDTLNLTSTTESDRVIIPRKLYLMSGHDHTLAGLLHTLGLYNDGTRPTFASAIMIELYGEEGQDPFDFTVQISYRNREGYDDTVKILEIPGCKTPCKYRNLLEIFQPFIPEDWTAECQASAMPFSETTNIVVWATVGVSAGIILLIICYLVRAFRKRQKSLYTSL